MCLDLVFRTPAVILVSDFCFFIQNNYVEFESGTTGQ